MCLYVCGVAVSWWGGEGGVLQEVLDVARCLARIYIYNHHNHFIHLC